MARDKSKEKQDKNGESIMHQFLERHFYNEVENYHYCNDKENQIKGIDSTFTFLGTDYKCDEKVALDFVNECKGYKLNTFCLELSFLDRTDKLQEGWLTKDTLETDSYLFVWLDKAKENILSSVDDIQEVEIVLVKKQDILDYLSSIKWTKEKLRRKAHNIRFKKDENFGNYKENGCKFAFSEYLKEKPVNILLTRYVYKHMPNTYSRKIVINEASNS